LDDIIIERSSKPITFLLAFVSLKIAINELSLSGNLLGNINAVINSVIVILIGYVFYVFIDIAIAEIWGKFATKAKLSAGESLSSLIHGLLKVLLVVLMIVYILDLWGVEVTPLLAGLGLAGLAIALALQPTLANVFSGISIIMDKSVRVGDLVYLDAQTKGKIKRVGLRSTRIITFDNELVIVPNTKLADSMIQNIALPEPKSRAVIQFGVAYGSEIDKVKKIVLKEINGVKNICEDPEPMVRFIEMGDSSLNFKVYFYVDHYSERFNAIDEANTKIYNALNKNGIRIPFPQMDVHLKKE